MTTIKQIKDSNGVSHELDSKYWGGNETLKTINGEVLFGKGNIDISVSGSNSIIEVIYEDLCELRNNNSLVPGQQYRIIDYVTTTVQENTESAGYQFDIIVTALNENTLSENADACYHDEVDNTSSISKFLSNVGWDGGGNTFERISRMVDDPIKINGKEYIGYTDDIVEHKNKLYFDFNDISKITYDNGNIIFYPSYYIAPDYGVTEITDVLIMPVADGGFCIPNIMLSDQTDDAVCEEIKETFNKNYFKNIGTNLSAWKLKYCLDNDTNKFAWADQNGKGVIYEMIDEFNNTLPYDFKNIQFKRFNTVGRVDGYVGVDGFETWSNLSLVKEDYKYLYTFSMIGETDIYDTSLNIYSNNENHLSVRNNCYLPNTINGKIYLNNIVHVCSESLEEGYVCEGVENTKTGVNCYNISLKDKCDNWVLGNHCHDIIMNMSCGGWVCEDECYNLIFGLNCSSWKLGHNCCNITVGNICIEWMCGDDCSGWSTGTNNSNWNCGSDCSNWETGPDCNYWVCGNKCHGWKTGSDCSYWTCGNNSHTWEVSDSNSYWTCGNAAYYWKVENTCRNFNVCSGVHGTSSTDKLLLDFPDYTALTKQQQLNASFNEYDMLTIWNPASPINYPIIKRTDTGPSASECIYLAPNVYNIWINNKLPKYVTLSMPKADMVGEYVLRFTIPSTVTNHSLVFSNEIKWVNNDIPTWEAGCTYEISIIDGYATFLKYSL